MIGIGLILVISLIILLMAWMATRPNITRPFWPRILKHQTRKSQNNVKVSILKDERFQHPLAGCHLQSSFVHQHDVANVHARVEGDAFSHLENCLRRIEKQFLPHPHEGASKLLGDTLIDQRVFWDCFRGESGAIVVLYHVDDMRVIFASTSVKRLLGYSAQDFRIRFHEIIHDIAAWKKHLYQLRWRQRLYAPIAFKDASARSGSGICAWDCYLAQIDRGHKAQYAVAVLYPAYCYLPRPALMSLD